MNLTKGNIVIRNAMASDAAQLCQWWNDGRVMAHAGFPNGINTTPEIVRTDIATDSDERGRRHIIELDGKPIGEMNYRNTGNGVAEIGIKICDTNQQEKGLGTTILSMFIDALFVYHGYEKVILDTNVKNTRAQHVYENKIGFKVVRRNENAWQDQLGEWQSSIDYELTKTDWIRSGRLKVSPTKPDDAAGSHDNDPGLHDNDPGSHDNDPGSHDNDPGSHGNPVGAACSRPQPFDYIHIRPERPADHYAVESLTRDAFWNTWGSADTKICDEHLLVHKLRSTPTLVPELNLVAELDSKIVGHIIYTVSKIVSDSGTEHKMLTFGPLSVAPEYQNRGIGKALLRHSFKVAKELGHRAVIIFGHPHYYPRVGFRRAAEFGITTADGKNFDPFMAYPLYEGALDGISGSYRHDPVYETLTQEDALEFDKKFPPKPQHIPTSIDVLLDRLPPVARDAIQALNFHSLAMIQTKSESELLALPGIDTAALETIRAVMQENSLSWGESKENRIHALLERAQNYKYSSMNYIEYDDCKNASIVHGSEDLILLQDATATPAMLHFAANDFNLVIDAISKLSGKLRIHFVPWEFFPQLEAIGFTVWGEFLDFFNTDLQATAATFRHIGTIEYLAPHECEEAAAFSQKCRLQSRGFEGETPEWFAKWQQENKIIVARENSQIVGLCAVSIYDMGTGSTLWIRMLAVDPAHQGKGYGKKLIEQAINYGVESSAIKGFLHTDVLNKNAIGLYDKYNFFASGDDGELQMIRSQS